MSESQIRNLFTKVSLDDLIIDGSKIPQLLFMPNTNDKISNLINRTDILSTDFIYMIGAKKIIIRKEELPLLLKITEDRPSVLFANDDLYKTINYQTVQLTDLRSYNPPGGYLYNLAKEHPKAPLVILDDSGNALAITYFDYIVRQIRKNLEVYY